MSNSFATPWTVAQHSPLSMGILQARILGWVAKSSSRGSSQPRDQTQVSCIACEFFTIWATREAELQMKREREKYIPNRGKKIPIEIRRGGLLWWLSGEESACRCRRHGFIPWSGKDPTCLRATKPLHHNCWAWEKQLLSPRTLEPVLLNKSSYHNEKLAHHN